MHEVKTEIEIAATPGPVRSILVDLPAHPRWNPFVRSIAGLPNAGERLKVAMQPVGGKGMTFRPTVLFATPAQDLLPEQGEFHGTNTMREKPGVEAPTGAIERVQPHKRSATAVRLPNGVTIRCALKWAMQAAIRASG